MASYLPYRRQVWGVPLRADCYRRGSPVENRASATRVAAWPWNRGAVRHLGRHIRVGSRHSLLKYSTDSAYAPQPGLPSRGAFSLRSRLNTAPEAYQCCLQAIAQQRPILHATYSEALSRVPTCQRSVGVTRKFNADSSLIQRPSVTP